MFLFTNPGVGAAIRELRLAYLAQRRSNSPNRAAHVDSADVELSCPWHYLADQIAILCRILTTAHLQEDAAHGEHKNGFVKSSRDGQVPKTDMGAID